MESLSYGFEGRGLVFADDVELRLDDSFMRSKNVLKLWDAELVSVPTCNSAESIGFVEPVLPHMLSNSVLGNQISENLGPEMSNDSGTSVPATSTITFNSLKEIVSKISRSAIQVDKQILVSADFNNKKHVARIERNRDRVPEEYLPAKRVKIESLQSQIVACQVLGCNKDLSASKDYHKRHRVCELHSKTAVVIVNGLQQRFCQQCSRFHQLPEFDEGKRSCRKRLADHNERRRKPPIDTHMGSTFFGTDSPSMSFLFPKNFHGDTFGMHFNKQMNINRQIKLEEEQSRLSQIELMMKFKMPHPKAPHLQGIGKQYPSNNCINVPFSVVQESSADSNSSSALSLLSAQYQSLSSKSSCIPIPHSLIFPENQQADICTSQNSSALKNFIPSIYESPDGADFQDSFPVVLDGFSSRFETPQSILSQEPNAVNAMCYVSPPEGPNTLDLFQLSSHLQRVEYQKYSAQVGLGYDIFCHSAST